MFDFDGDVISEVRIFGVQSFHDASGVRDSVEKIGIAERDVLRAGVDLLADVGEDGFLRDDAELAFVNGNDGTVAAEMLAAARSFRVPGNAVCAVWRNDVSVFVESRETGTVGNLECQAWDF